MKRTEPKPIGEIIREAVEMAGLADTVAEQRVCYLWSTVMGPQITRYTMRRYVQNGILHVYLTSASLRNELSFFKSRLVEQLNSAVGKEVIHDIVFH